MFIFRLELLAKHSRMGKSGFGSQKHKKLGYKMFKDKYNGKVKANVVKGRMPCFLVKDV